MSIWKMIDGGREGGREGRELRLYYLSSRVEGGRACRRASTRGR